MGGKSSPEHRHQYYMDNRERLIKTTSEYRKAHPEIRRNYTRLQRQKILTLLGGKCVRCGYSDWRGLQIDHINGGGAREYRSHGGNAMYRKILYMDIEKVMKHYQILCANCNWIKRYEKMENGPVYTQRINEAITHGPI